MNALHAELAAKGVLIVGVSDETEEKLQNYIQSKGVEFPIIRAQGVLKKFGGRGYPTFVTIGADGKIAAGDRIPAKGLLVKLGKKTKVLPDLSAKYAGIRKSWKKQAWADVLKAVDVALEGQPEAGAAQQLESLKSSVDGRIAASEASIKRAGEGPDYYAGQLQLQAIAKNFAGLPVAETAAGKLKELQADSEIARELKLGKKLHKQIGRYDTSKSSGRRKQAAALQKFASKYSGTKAAEIARAKLRSMSKR